MSLPMADSGPARAVSSRTETAGDSENAKKQGTRAVVVSVSERKPLQPAVTQAEHQPPAATKRLPKIAQLARVSSALPRKCRQLPQVWPGS